MSSTNHPSPAVSNSLFYSKTAVTVSCGVVHNTLRFMFSHLLRPHGTPLINNVRMKTIEST